MGTRPLARIPAAGRPFNLATALTIACGAVVLYVAQFAVLLGAALILLTPNVLGDALHHHANIGDYVKLVWLAASLATTGGALGTALESDGAVREAAYAYRPTTVGRRAETSDLSDGRAGSTTPAATK